MFETRGQCFASFILISYNAIEYNAAERSDFLFLIAIIYLHS